MRIDVIFVIGNIMIGTKNKSQIDAIDLFKNESLQDVHEEYELIIQEKVQEIDSYLNIWNHDLSLMEKKINSLIFLSQDRIEFTVNHSYNIVWDRQRINAQYIAPTENIKAWEKPLIECSFSDRLFLYPRLQEFYSYVMDFLINNKLTHKG